MMYKISKIIVILLLVLIIIGIFLILISRTIPTWIFGLEKRIKEIPNFFAFIGILLTILSILAACLITVPDKESHLKATIVDGYKEKWDKMHPFENAPYTIDKERHWARLPSQELNWGIAITNKGNTSAHNVIIEISVDHYSFLGTSDDFILKGHNYGLGSYTHISQTYEIIQPNTEIILPHIPFEMMANEDECWDDEETQGTVLHITIYEDNNAKQEFTFQGDYYYMDDIEEGECFHSPEDQAIVFELNELRDSELKYSSMFSNPTYTYSDCKLFLKNHPEISTSNLRVVYFHSSPVLFPPDTIDYTTC